MVAEENAAAIQFAETGDHPQERRLSAAGGTQQGEKLAVADGNRDIVDRPHLGERLRDAVDRYRRHASPAIQPSSRTPDDVLDFLRSLDPLFDPQVLVVVDQLDIAELRHLPRQLREVEILPRARGGKRNAGSLSRTSLRVT